MIRQPSAGSFSKKDIYFETSDELKDKPYKHDNPCVCCCGCVFSCCLPSLVWTCCCCVPFCSSLSIDSKERASRWLIRNNQCSTCLSPFTCCCYYIDLLYDCNCSDTGKYFLKRRDHFAPNQNFFCSFNKVNIWEKEQCDQLLLSEQCRGSFLGATDFHSKNLPHSRNGDKLFLLEISGKLAPHDNPNNNRHKKLYNTILSLATSPECMARIDPSNFIMANIIAYLEKDISDTKGDKRALVNIAIPKFLIRALHWGILNLELKDKDLDTVYNLYYGSNPFSSNSGLYHFRGSGPIISSCTSVQSQYKKVAEIYKRSPVLKSWGRNVQNGMLEQEDIIQVIQRTLTVAGLQGPLVALRNIITGDLIPYEFQYPIDDRDKMRLVILETMRMSPPVNSSCIVTDTPLTCPYSSGNKKYRFPPKTPVLINFVLQGQDERVYPDPSWFNPYGRSEQLWGPKANYTFFNGVGDKGPRRCPGRDLALELMITVLQTSLGLLGTFKNRPAVKPISSGLTKTTVNGVTNILAAAETLKNLTTSDDEPSVGWILKCDTATKAWTDACLLMVDNSKKEREATSISVFHDKMLLPKLPKVFTDPSYSNSTIYTLKFAETDEEENDITNQTMSIFLVSLENDEKHHSNEKLYYFDSKDEGILVGKTKFKNCLPKYEVMWEDMNHVSDDGAFSALFFYGLGMQYLERINPTKHSDDSTKMQAIKRQIDDNSQLHYIADLSFLSKYTVRSKYIKYGATVYFNSNRVPIAIWIDEQERVIVPADGDSWIHAKAIIRSSLITAITLIDHLAHLHWITSNGFQLACRETLSSTHPLRRLLKPHFYRTAKINYTSTGVLLPVHGLAYKVFGVAASSWDQALYDALSLYKYQTFPEFIQSKGFSSDELKNFPLADDGLEYWNIVHKYVSSYIEIFYPNEEAINNDTELHDYWHHYQNSQIGTDLGIPKELSKSALTDHTTYCIFQVTGGHEYLGGIVEYLTDPTLLPSKLAADASSTDVQSSFLALSLISLTGMRQPNLINDWSHLHEYLTASESEENKTKYNAVINVLNTFQTDLKQQSQVIDDRNNTRLLMKNITSEMSWNTFNSFNPRVMECSVSV